MDCVAAGKCPANTSFIGTVAWLLIYWLQWITKDSKVAKVVKCMPCYMTHLLLKLIMTSVGDM